jgi:hypothetical protein
MNIGRSALAMALQNGQHALVHAWRLLVCSLTLPACTSCGSATHNTTVGQSSPTSSSATTVSESTIAPTNVNGTTANGESYGTAPVDPSGEGLSAPQAAAQSPDYIAVRGARGGVVGYAKKADLFVVPPQALAVYAQDLTTIVGHLYSRKGFIPVGVNPDTVPTFLPSGRTYPLP